MYKDSTVHLTDHREGFADGYTAITHMAEGSDTAGIALGVLKLQAGETHRLRTDHETAWLLMAGEVEVQLQAADGLGEAAVSALSRESLFDQTPSCVHVSAEWDVVFRALTAVEFTVYEVANTKGFPPAVYHPQDVADEHRGRGHVGDACYRFVRTIFDGSTAPPAAQLVLGEVITMPGRWSSYPPHHHAQPELYHYRFTRPQGFGFAQLGDGAVQVKQNDTVKILDCVDHAQVAAPGYGMYYSWVIRHLPQAPYTVPDFAPEHAWTKDAAANREMWWPQGVPGGPESRG